MRLLGSKDMNIFFIAVLSVFFLVGVKAQEPSPSPRPVDSTRRWTEYGDIRFSDEKRLLDHLAVQLKKGPERVLYLLVYSDWRSCQHQGRARAVRAKNYLVKHQGIEASRVVWKDGGFGNDLSIEVWLIDSDEIRPEPYSILDQSWAKQMRQRRCHKGKRVRIKSSAAHN